MLGVQPINQHQSFKFEIYSDKKSVRLKKSAIANNCVVSLENSDIFKMALSMRSSV